MSVLRRKLTKFLNEKIGYLQFLSYYQKVVPGSGYTFKVFTGEQEAQSTFKSASDVNELLLLHYVQT